MVLLPGGGIPLAIRARVLRAVRRYIAEQWRKRAPAWTEPTPVLYQSIPLCVHAPKFSAVRTVAPPA